MRDELDLNQLRTFAAVMDHGGFAAAARARELPVSHVSRHVAALERHLGTRLLERSTRHCRPTAAGLRLYARAEQALRELKDAEAELSDEARTLGGPLKLCLQGESLGRLIAPVLTSFSVMHPGVQLECETRFEPPDMLRTGHDLVLSFRRGREQDSQLAQKRLASFASVVVASPALVLERRQPLPMTALRSLPCISSARALGGDPWRFIGARGRAVSVPVQVSHRIDGAALARDAAVSGLGLAILSRQTCVHELVSQLLVEVPLELPPAPLELVATLPHRAYRPRRVRALLSALETGLCMPRQH